MMQVARSITVSTPLAPILLVVLTQRSFSCTDGIV
jgi:hypothetical protein